MEEIATKDFRFVAQGVVIDPLGRTHTPAVSVANVSIRPQRATMDLLPLIPLEDGDSASGLRMGGTIGQGGMGLVRKATQLALDREVAAKTVRPDRRTPETIKQLLQEAWITGRLERIEISLADNTTLAHDDDQLLAETIFSFEHALRIWGSNKEAERGLQQALEHAFFQSIAHRRLSTAEHWLRRMPHPRSEHNRAMAEGRVAAGRRAEIAEEAEQHRRGHDLNVGREERVRLAIFAAVSLSTLPWVDAYLEGLLRPSIGAHVLFAAPLLAWVIAGSAMVLGRVAHTEIARKIGCACIMAAAMSSTTRYLVFTGTIVTERLLLLDLVPFLVILSMLALFIDPRLRVSLGLAAVAFGSALHAPPSELPFFFALAHLVGIGSIAWIWSKPTDQVACNPVAHRGGKGSRPEADSSS